MVALVTSQSQSPQSRHRRRCQALARALMEPLEAINYVSDTAPWSLVATALNGVLFKVSLVGGITTEQSAQLDLNACATLQGVGWQPSTGTGFPILQVEFYGDVTPSGGGVSVTGAAGGLLIGTMSTPTYDSGTDKTTARWTFSAPLSMDAYLVQFHNTITPGHAGNDFVMGVSVLFGDTNSDGVVNITDLSMVSNRYGQMSDTTWQTGDLNLDGMVNITDLSAVCMNYGRRVGAIPPASPSSLSAETNGSTAITLNWLNNASDGQVQIQRSTDGTNFTNLAPLAAGTTSFQDTGLTPNTAYAYRAVALSTGSGIPASSYALTATSSADLTISGPASYQSGQPVSVTLASTDSSLSTSGAITLDWGDGHADLVTGNPAAPLTHTYSASTAAYAVRASAATSLTIASGEIRTLDTTATNALVLSDLSIATDQSGNPLGTLDLGRHDLIIQLPDATSANAMVSRVQGLLQSGYNASGTHWTGPGIVSSFVRGHPTRDLALGYLRNVAADGTTPLRTSFDGVPVNANTVLVKYTYKGDTNLDGSVDESDQSAAEIGYANPANAGNAANSAPFAAMTWTQGDFNYDGMIQESESTGFEDLYGWQDMIPTPSGTPTTAAISNVLTLNPTLTSSPSEVLWTQSAAYDITISGNATTPQGDAYTLNLATTDSSQINYWSIDWGDGQTDQVAPDAAIATHPYTTALANYTITAAAIPTDETAPTVVARQSVTVTNVAPTVSLDGFDTMAAGIPYTLHVDSYDPGNDIASWTINWGDSSTTTTTTDPWSGITHLYTDTASSYDITTTATDAQGLTTTSDPLTVTRMTDGGTLQFEGDVDLSNLTLSPGTYENYGTATNHGGLIFSATTTLANYGVFNWDTTDTYDPTAVDNQGQLNIAGMQEWHTADGSIPSGFTSNISAAGAMYYNGTDTLTTFFGLGTTGGGSDASYGTWSGGSPGNPFTITYDAAAATVTYVTGGQTLTTSNVTWGTTEGMDALFLSATLYSAGVSARLSNLMLTPAGGTARAVGDGVVADYDAGTASSVLAIAGVNLHDDFTLSGTALFGLPPGTTMPTGPALVIGVLAGTTQPTKDDFVVVANKSEVTIKAGGTGKVEVRITDKATKLTNQPAEFKEVGNSGLKPKFGAINDDNVAYITLTTSSNTPTIDYDVVLEGTTSREGYKYQITIKVHVK